MGLRTLAVLQPSYLPWLGALEQIARSDVFVFYDDVQFDKNGWRNRNRIRTASAEGWSWLTVPVRLDEHFPRICSVKADARAPWRRKHERTIRAEYARAPHLEVFDEFFPEFFAGTEELLADIAIRSTTCLMEAFGITTPWLRSSEMTIEGDRNARLIAICEQLGATDYYSGAAAQAYLDVRAFEARGIRVRFQEYRHPEYLQTREPFISHLSALDALLNLGTGARDLLGVKA